MKCHLQYLKYTGFSIIFFIASTHLKVRNIKWISDDGDRGGHDGDDHGDHDDGHGAHDGGGHGDDHGGDDDHDAHDGDGHGGDRGDHDDDVLHLQQMLVLQMILGTC